jgi:hypothetical protein
MYSLLGVTKVNGFKLMKNFFALINILGLILVLVVDLLVHNEETGAIMA